MTKPQHTATPWTHKTQASQDIRDPLFWHCDVIKGGVRVARVSGIGAEEATANAEHIVRCVNSHEELVEALIRIKQEIVYMDIKELTKVERNILLHVDQALFATEGGV